MSAEAKYLVWSIEHQAWWAPRARGYTTHLAEAGRYTKNAAGAILRQANYAPHIHHEVMIPEFCVTPKNRQNLERRDPVNDRRNPRSERRRSR